MSYKRKFKDLTIRDNFMFAAVMMRDDNCKKFLEMLLGISIRKIDISYEKSLIYNPECKGVRLDVYANDENNTRYDIDYSDFCIIPINQFEGINLLLRNQFYRNKYFCQLA